VVVSWLFAVIFRDGIEAVEGWHVLEGAHVDRVINHARVAAASACTPREAVDGETTRHVVVDQVSAHR